MAGKRTPPAPPPDGLRGPGPGGADSGGPDGTAHEADARARGFRRIAGVDEAGRGPLAGPVVAAAVVFEPGIFNPDIKDSKVLSARRRERLADWIRERAASWAVGAADPGEIDRLNILRASLLAMARALRGLKAMPDFVMVDGPHGIPVASLRQGGGPWAAPPAQQTLKGGDRRCFSIAAASIIAKVARDRMMVEFDALYPEYGFGSHKGYQTRRHAAALDLYGPCPIHRRSFRPVRESCESPQPRTGKGAGGSLPLALPDATNRHG